MNEDFVSYEQAVKLRECGFDWRCHAYYTNDYINTDPEDITRKVRFHREWYAPYDHNCVVGRTSAPTLWQAQKWLREVKGLHVQVAPCRDGDTEKMTWRVVGVYSISEFMGTSEFKVVASYCETDHPTYETALSAGITAALELIEKKGE